MNSRRRYFGRLLQPIAVVIAVVALAATAFHGVTGAQAQTATDFVAGDAVVVNTDSLQFRTDATLDADVVSVLNDGTLATVIEGPVSADGYTWYALDVDGLTGWAAGEFLALATETGPIPVDTVVTISSDSVNLRDAAGLSGGVITQLDTGAVATVLAGPESVDGFDWYQLDVDGTTGWAVRDFLAFAVGGGTTLTPDSTALVNTDSLTLRDGAGLDAGVIDSLPGGSTVTIVSGPTDLDGYSWYEVSTDLGDGWVAGDFLLAA
jgi:uncharacterized protein YraI